MGANRNEVLAKEVNKKTVIKKLKRRKVYARFKYNTWAADLAKMESLSSKNQGTKYLSYVIGVCTKFAWVISFKDKSLNLIESG